MRATASQSPINAIQFVDQVERYVYATAKYLISQRFSSPEDSRKFYGKSEKSFGESNSSGSSALGFITEVIISHQRNAVDGITGNSGINKMVDRLRDLLNGHPEVLALLNDASEVSPEKAEKIAKYIQENKVIANALTSGDGVDALFEGAFDGIIETVVESARKSLKDFKDKQPSGVIIGDEDFDIEESSNGNGKVKDPYGVISVIYAGIGRAKDLGLLDAAVKEEDRKRIIKKLPYKSKARSGLFQANKAHSELNPSEALIDAEEGKLLGILEIANQIAEDKEIIRAQSMVRGWLARRQVKELKSEREQEKAELEQKEKSEKEAADKKAEEERKSALEKAEADKKEAEKKAKADKEAAYKAKLAEVSELGRIKQISGQQLGDHNGMEINLYSGAAGYNAFSAEVENARSDEGNLFEGKRTFKTKGGESEAAYSMAHLQNVPYLGGGDAYAIVVKDRESTTVNFFASKAQFESALKKQKDYYDKALSEITEEGQEYYDAADVDGKKAIRKEWEKYAKNAAAAKFFEEDVKEKLDNKEPNISKDDEKVLADMFAAAQRITIFNKEESEKSRKAVEMALEAKSPNVETLSPGISITGFPGAQHQHTAHVTFTPADSGDYEGHDIAYVKLPNTSNCYRRVQVSPQDGWECRIVENGKLVNKTFNKGEIIPGKATICHFNSKTGTYKEYDVPTLPKKLWRSLPFTKVSPLIRDFGEEEAKNIVSSYNKLTIVAVSSEHASVIQGDNSVSKPIGLSLDGEDKSVASIDMNSEDRDSDFDIDDKSQDSASVSASAKGGDGLGHDDESDLGSQDSADFSFDADDDKDIFSIDSDEENAVKAARKSVLANDVEEDEIEDDGEEAVTEAEAKKRLEEAKKKAGSSPRRPLSAAELIKQQREQAAADPRLNGR